MVTVGSTTGDGFGSLDSGHKLSSVAPKIGPATISTVLVLSVLVIKNKTRNKDFLPKMDLRKNRKKKKTEKRIWKVLYVDQRNFFL